uniref:Uncharacterized protein n=1 Tax=Glossina austeni TaxID=7395 RepID=A0A1A9VYR8_GLOAU
MSSIIPPNNPLEEYNMKRFYNCVLSQTLSASGNFLFAGNRFGDIFVQNIVNTQNANEPHAPIKIYSQGKNVEINSLAFHIDFLIVGSIGIIYGLIWLEEKGELINKRSWEVNIPLEVNAMEVPDVNCMCLRSSTNRLYAGCGDNAAYEIDLNDGRIIRDFRGHEDYIHSISGIEDKNLYTASEDGTVRFWSLEQTESTNMIEPYKKDQLMRPELGKWMGSVASNGDWLVCGGGPKLSLWHLRAMEYTSDFPFSGKIHICDFVEDMIFVGGEHSNAQFYAMNGHIRADIKTDNTTIYSAAFKLESQRFMSIAGFSNWLSILNDFRFLDSKIELYVDKNQSNVDNEKRNK